MDNIVIVVPSTPTYGKAPKVYQYNYGQILRIQGLNLPKVAEVHFSYNETYGDSVTRIANTKDGVTDVPIPDSFLENNDSKTDYTVYAYIYLEDGTSGETVCKIDIPVKARSKPEVPGTPEEPELFRETVKAVNDAADRAETAEQNAKTSETEAGKYATSASKSAVAAEKTKEDALREVGEKKQEAIEAVQEQEETSVGKIINHTDNEIQRVQDQTAESKGELEQTITNAGVSKKELEHSIETAGTSKTALDKSVELAGTAKTELDTSIREADEAKTALNGSAKTAGAMQETLSETVKQAGTLDTSLGEKIETGTQLKTDLVASGEKAVQGIQTAGSEQLGKMQAVAEEFAADREQITTNKEDISSLKEEMGKNFLDDAKTKRSLDALWKLNQGISYQFETDAEKAYQKDIPSGAKLVSVKKIGGRTIVWNQLATNIVSNWNFESSNSATVIEEEDYMSSTIKKSSSHILWERYNNNRFAPILGQKYYVTINVFLPKKANVHYRTYGYETSGKSIEANIWYTYSDIISPQKGDDSGRPFSIIFSPYNDNTFESGDKFMFKNIMVFDLTQMFGAGNEPSTPEEFEALFPEDYYPYNEGELMSMPVNEVVEQGRNLLPDCTKIGKFNGITFVRNGDGSLTVSGTSTSSYLYLIGNVPVEKGKKYKLTGAPVGCSSKSYRLWVASKLAFPEGKRLFDTGSGGEATALEDEIISVNIQVMNGVTVKDLTFRPMLTHVDTEGDFSPYHKNTYPIPQAILDLDGYGDGVSDDVYNYVDWENKQYHKRVGKVDLGSLIYAPDGSSNMVWYTYELPKNLTSANAISNKLTYDNCSDKTLWTEDSWYLSGSRYFEIYSKEASTALDISKKMQGTMLYYELAKEEIIDISDIIDNIFQEPIEVEAGGTLTFCNSNGDGYQLPIPNEEEYIVSLAEVGGGASE